MRGKRLRFFRTFPIPARGMGRRGKLVVGPQLGKFPICTGSAHQVEGIAEEVGQRILRFPKCQRARGVSHAAVVSPVRRALLYIFTDMRLVPQRRGGFHRSFWARGEMWRPRIRPTTARLTNRRRPPYNMPTLTGRTSTAGRPMAAARYVELNPVRAGLVGDAAEWRWSTARSHALGRDDRLVRTAPLLAMIPDWRALLGSAMRAEELRAFREHGRTGRPLGSASFLDRLETMVGRILQPQKGGRPSKLHTIP